MSVVFGEVLRSVGCQNISGIHREHEFLRNDHTESQFHLAIILLPRHTL